MSAPLPARSGRVLVSVVFSFRNEAENIRALIARLEAVFASEEADYELIFVNDASTDASLELLMKEHARNPNVKVVNLSRRFGVAEGVLAGMAVASGDAVVYMDADLQDPPEVIPALLVRWREGADVVHTIRTKRHGEHPLKMWITRLGYRAIRVGATTDLPVNAGDFKLLSKHVVSYLLQMKETDPYLRGLVAWVGFKQAFVPYEREARHKGSTHFPLLSRGPWKAFLVGFSSFSFLPIYTFGIMAAVSFAVSVVLTAVGTVAWLNGAAGALALAGIVGMMWSILLGAVAIVGLYVLRVYKDGRRRPAYIVASTVGLGEDTAAPLAAHPHQRA
jgi:glycosyltransferase involved in cell wall biosynthesis